MPSQVVAFFRPKRRSADWSTEEIAELYRIEHALLEARFSLETDRGVSDEGDPWFVFCRTDGEVLVHIARIDDEYHLFSGGLAQPLRGRFISDLSKSFVRQLPPQLPVRRTDGTQLFVHPSAALAILIGTIFVAYDDVRLDMRLAADAGDDAGSSDDIAAKPVMQIAVSKFAEGIFGGVRAEAAGREATYFNIVCAVAAAIGSAALVTVGDQSELSKLNTLEDSEVAVVGTHAAHTPNEVTFESLDDLVKVENSTQAVDVALLSGQGAAEEGRGVFAAVSGDDRIVAKLESPILEPVSRDGSGAEKASIGLEYPQDMHLHSLQAEPANTASVGAAGSGALSSGHRQSGVTVEREAPAGSSHELNSGASQPLALAAGTHGNLASHSGLVSIEDFLQSVLKLGSSPIVVGTGTAALAEEAAASEITQFSAGIESTVSSTLYPLFNAAAQEILTNFLRQNVDAQVVFAYGNVVVYDGWKDFDARPVTVQVWEFDTGATIAIVGHVDDASLS